MTFSRIAAEVTDATLLAAQARLEAGYFFDEAEFALARALELIAQVREDTAWDATAARAFRYALGEFDLTLIALRSEVASCREHANA